MRLASFTLLCALPLLLWIWVHLVLPAHIQTAWIYGDTPRNDYNGWGITLPFRAHQDDLNVSASSQTSARLTTFGLGIIYFPFQTGNFHISADDCVESIVVNNVMLPGIKKISANKRCGFRSGIDVDLAPYLIEGRNIVDITVSNAAGKRVGLDVNPRFLPLPYKIIQAFQTFLVVLAIVPALMRLLRFDGNTILMLLTACMCALLQFYSTTFQVFAPDSHGHLRYIWHVANYWKVPQPQNDWQYYQQPLYYYIAAVMAHLGRWLGTMPLEPARELSIAMMMAFNLYGLLIIRRLIHTPWIRFTCMAILLFWPLSSVLHGRLSNEIMLYMFWAAAFFHALRWHQQHKRHDLALAIGISGVSVIVKTSGIVPLFCVILLAAWHINKRRSLLKLLLHWGVITALCITALCVTLNIARTIYYKTGKSQQMGLIIGNIHLDPFLYNIVTDNSPEYLFYFDLKKYVSHPYCSFTRHEWGSLYFWNVYLKSLLYGDFQIGLPQLASMINIFWLFMVMFLIYACIINRQYRKEWALAGASIGIILLAQLINRMIVQTTVTPDARFTYPIIILIAVLVGHHLEIFSREGKTRSLLAGKLVTAAFATSIILFVMLGWTANQ